MASQFLRWNHAKERGGLIELPHNKVAASKFFFIPFLFNPAEFTEEEGQSYEVKKVPLWPDPIIQYVGGDGATFKFEMALEQERIWEFFSIRNTSDLLNLNPGGLTENGQIGERNFFTGSIDELKAGVQFPLTLEEYIARVEVLKFPKQNFAPGNLYDASPSRVMVVFGKFFRIGFIEKTSIKYKEFFTDGSLRSASIEVSMRLAYGRANFYRNQVARFAGGLSGNA